MWRLSSVAALILTTAVAPAAPPPVSEAFSSTDDSFFVAARDLLKYRPVSDRVFQRYLSLHHMTLEERQQAILALTLHVNHLSRGASLRAPHVVFAKNTDGRPAPVLLRVDLRHYDWDAPTFERLAPANVYYNVNRLVTEIVKGKASRKRRAVTARWLSQENAKLLLAMTQSQTPVVRADWFFVQSVVHKNRTVGYYDWLKVKSRDDFFKLTGADRKRAEQSGKEWAAIIQKSRVAQRNRQVFRFGVIDGGGWFTKDAFKNETKRRNAINFLGSDFQHDAEEIIIPLPNGLFGYFLCDNNGVLQETAPADVGADTTTTSNDPEIHPYLSCVRCHSDGLRKLDDYGRRLFTGDQKLVVIKDFAKFERFAQLYLRPIERHRRRDLVEYEQVLSELVGRPFKPSELAELYTNFYRRWRDDDVSLEQAARELGVVSAIELRRALTLYATSQRDGGLGKILPLSLLGFTKNPPLDMLREHYEEAYDALHLIVEETAPLRGVKR